ncbi:MAG: PilN domain-containing protein [Gallionellaceae bacterium]|jgi:Tfp pilus assembly protein PilN
MPNLTLNFAAKQVSLQTWNPLLGSTILIIGVTVFGFAVADYRQQLSLNSDLQEKSSQLQNNAGLNSRKASTPLALENEIAQANLAYTQLQTPWGEIFSALETARNAQADDVALLSIKADSNKRELRISGEAKDFPRLSAFSAALSDSPMFKNIHLSNDKLNVSTVPIVVSFDLQLNWAK